MDNCGTETPALQPRCPTKYHGKKRDIYACGVLLLEIGMWGLVGKLFNDESGKVYQRIRCCRRL
jgi:hypothetical protein